MLAYNSSKRIEGEIKMTSKDECRCEYGYYCRFCRLMDHRDEQIKYEKQREKEATIAELERDQRDCNL